MNETSEDFGNSLASLSKGAQAIAAEASEYTSKSVEAGGAAAARLLSAKSLEDALDIQSDYLKRSYEGFVAQATKIGSLYADLAKDAYKPFETMVAKAK